MLANQAANTARLYIYDGLANLMSDTAARRTGVIYNLGTIEHLASTHVAAHDGVAYITTFGQTWIRSVTITGSSTGDFNATRLIYSPGANSWPVDGVRSAGIADGPNGIWIQRAPPPQNTAANTRADTLYEWTGGSSGATPTGNTLRMHLGPDDVAINFDLGFGWSTSDQRIFLGQVLASGTPGRRITPAQITFTNVTDVTSIGDKLYAINTSGIIREYPNELDAAGPAAGWLRRRSLSAAAKPTAWNRHGPITIMHDGMGWLRCRSHLSEAKQGWLRRRRITMAAAKQGWLRFGRMSFPKPMAWNRHGPITIMHDSMGWLRHGPYASAAKQGWLRRRMVTMAAVRQGWQRWGLVRATLGTGWQRWGLVRATLGTGWLRHRAYSAPIVGGFTWQLRPGAPAPALAGLTFTNALAADQAPVSRKLYAIDPTGIVEFEGDGSNPLATKLRTFLVPPSIANQCIAVQGSKLWGCRTTNGTIRIVEYMIPETGTALVEGTSHNMAIRGTAFGLSIRQDVFAGLSYTVGSLLYEEEQTEPDEDPGYYVVNVRGTHVTFHAGNPVLIDPPLTRPRSIACSFGASANVGTIYIGERNGRILAYDSINNDVDLGPPRPDLDVTIPIDAAAVTGLTITPDMVMYALRRQPGEVYSLTLRHSPPGGFGWLRRRAITMTPTVQGWLRRRRITMAAAKQGWLRFGRMSFPKPMAWNRHGLITIMYDSMGWLRHGAYASTAPRWGWLRSRAIVASPARWGWLRLGTITIDSARQGWLRHGHFSAGIRQGWQRWELFRSGLRTGWYRWGVLISGLRTGWWRHGISRAPRFSFRNNAAGVRKRYFRV